jgi:hypothetical protein
MDFMLWIERLRAGPKWKRDKVLTKTLDLDIIRPYPCFPAYLKGE